MLLKFIRETGIPASVSNTAGTFFCSHLRIGFAGKGLSGRPGMIYSGSGRQNALKAQAFCLSVAGSIPHIYVQISASCFSGMGHCCHSLAMGRIY